MCVFLRDRAVSRRTTGLLTLSALFFRTEPISLGPITAALAPLEWTLLDYAPAPLVSQAGHWLDGPWQRATPSPLSAVPARGAAGGASAARGHGAWAPCRMRAGAKEHDGRR